MRMPVTTALPTITIALPTIVVVWPQLWTEAPSATSAPLLFVDAFPRVASRIPRSSPARRGRSRLAPYHQVAGLRKLPRKAERILIPHLPSRETPPMT